MTDLVERLRETSSEFFEGGAFVLATDIGLAATEIERLGREVFEQSIVLEAHRQTKKRLDKAVVAAKLVEANPSLDEYNREAWKRFREALAALEAA